jgi:phage shock protein A
MWKRFSLWIKAKFSKQLDKMENVEETLDYSYQRQLEQLQQAKRGIADLVTAKKRIQLQQTKMEQRVAKLTEQARQALQGGNEELARQALERKQLMQAELSTLDQQVAELQAQQDSLIANEAKLRQKVETFRSRKEVIKAQYSAAEAQVRISEAATGVGEEMADVGMAMQRAMDKTENMRARANAMEELEKAGTFEDALGIGMGEDDIDRQLRELGAGGAVQSDLDRMKAELGMTVEQPAIEAAPENVIDISKTGAKQQARG